MKIARLEPSSLIEWPGKLSAVVYTIGCGMRCHFCYNAELVLPDIYPAPIDEGQVIKTIKQRNSFLDAVAITGGDPLIQEDIEAFIAKIRSLGLFVKLDTNGLNDNRLAMLLARKAIDYVAIDYKAPISQYERYVGVKVDTKAITNSIKNIARHAKDYEVRTTVAPGMTKHDLYKIADELSSLEVKHYYLQHFISPSGSHMVNPKWKSRKAMTIREIKDVWGEIKMMFDRGGVRG